MALVHIDGDDLVVVIEGLDKLWAFKSSLTIPLANVRGATADPGIAADPKGIRAPGAHLPGVITAGTFHLDGEKVFWDVKDASKAVVIELADERTPGWSSKSTTRARPSHWSRTPCAERGGPVFSHSAAVVLALAVVTAAPAEATPGL